MGKVAVSFLKIVELGLAARILSHETATLPISVIVSVVCGT